jgi:hypothetical protein
MRAYWCLRYENPLKRPWPVRTEDYARSAINAIRKSEVDGVFSPRLLSPNIPGLILDVAPKRAIPTMFETPFYVERTGLASYGADKYVERPRGPGWGWFLPASFR